MNTIEEIRQLREQLEHERAERWRAEAALHSRLAFESLVTRISARFLSVPLSDIDAAINQALAEIGVLAGVDRSFVFRFSEDGSCITNTHEWCAPGIPSMIQQARELPLAPFAYANRYLLRGEVWHVPCVAELPAEAAYEREFLSQQGVRSLINVPLLAQYGVIGFLGFDAVRSEKTWSEDSIALLQVVGELIVHLWQRRDAEAALQADQRLLEERVDARTRQLRSLLEVQQALSSRLDLDTVMRRIAEEARHLIGASFGSVSVREDERLCIKALAGDYGPGMFVGYCMPVRASASGRAMLSGKVVRVDSLKDPRVYRDAMEQSHIQSMLAVPLLSGETALGVISVGHYSPAAFDETDEQVLSMLAPGAVIALENARLYAQAQQVAVLEERQRLARDLHDAVTQTLFSASLIADVLPRIWQRRPAEAERRLAELRQLTRGALAEMRTLLLELRPNALIEAQLGEVLRQLGEAITGRARLPVTVTVEGDCVLPPDVQIALYRIAQEALNNALRHAHAGQLQIDLAMDADQVRLSVCDDGQGFVPAPPETGHFGLRNMQERARSIGAAFSIDSRLGEGTKISVLWQAAEEDAYERT